MSRQNTAIYYMYVIESRVDYEYAQLEILYFLKLAETIIQHFMINDLNFVCSTQAQNNFKSIVA